MINKEMEKLINNQINKELYSAYLYFSMSAYLEDIGLPGFGNWLRVQAMEEQAHAKKFYSFLLERGGKVILSAIDAPPAQWKSPLDVAKSIYEHEQMVTELINNLVDLAIKLKDHASNNFLQWFVGEQVEEESNASTMVQSLKLIGDDSNGLFVLDKELMARVFVPPTGVTI